MASVKKRYHRHGRPHDARMASDHDDASDPLDLQTLKVAGIVLACILGAAAVIALAGAM